MPEEIHPSSPQEPQASEVKPDFDPILFRWNAMVAPPWDPGTYYFFLMPETFFYDPLIMEYPLDIAENLHAVLSSFCAASSYAGLAKAADRISSDFIMKGQDSGEALLMATIATQLVQTGIAHFVPDFTHVLIHAKAEKKEPPASFPYPTSIMHTWAFVQACEYLEKDLLPMFQAKDGSDSYPFGEIADVRRAIETFYEPMRKDLNNVFAKLDPYQNIADLRVIGEKISETSPSAP
ncbi:MAG: hypothetical protein ACOY3I_01300 [Verrucomicrobiota bacterium]